MKNDIRDSSNKYCEVIEHRYINIVCMVYVCKSDRSNGCYGNPNLENIGIKS